LYQSKGARNLYLDAYGLTSIKQIPNQESEADIIAKASADIYDKLGSFDNLAVKEKVNKLRDTFLEILKSASESETATKTACADMLDIANKIKSLHFNKPAVHVRVNAIKNTQGRYRSDMLGNKSKRYAQKRKAEESLYQLDECNRRRRKRESQEHAEFAGMFLDFQKIFIWGTEAIQEIVQVRGRPFRTNM